jgi:hypothetical protein
MLITDPPEGICSTATKVDRYRLVEQFGRHTQQRGRDRRDAGIVDQHIDAPEPGDSRVHQFLALVPVADMAPNSQGLASQGGDLVCHMLALLQLSAGDNHVCPGFGKPQRHGPA